ncbi:hypothetical protein SAMN04487946_110128 [Halobellus clavatus]|uniref:Uncharacterized protein n=2 Tax=Halobellus clavatus TaxID=660517 RepID=A0A1H3IQ75_9EURY|nr:hypothetical protein SAMN04487946_110128 [Halobellus clavatus]
MMEHSDADPRATDGETGTAHEQISAHQSSPDRVVFTEADNSDGWIALDADAAVTIER